jgi:outer membrane immunogenic protein
VSRPLDGLPFVDGPMIQGRRNAAIALSSRVAERTILSKTFKTFFRHVRVTLCSNTFGFWLHMSGGSIRQAKRLVRERTRCSVTPVCAIGLAVIAGQLSSSAPARAADLNLAPRVAPVASAPAAIYTWTGFYIGGQAGAGIGRSSLSDPLAGGTDAFPTGAGFLGGGVVGANYQWNRILVLGVEGDFNWTGIRGGANNSLGDALGTDTQWTSTVTGRVGAAFDRLLIYGKGGAAFARDRNSFTDLAGNSASRGFTQTGWTAGVGLEYGISKNWSAKIEYDYLSFGSQPLSLSTATPTAFPSSASLNVQEFKAGINFHFGGP